MRVAFTGTRAGMTAAQLAGVARVLEALLAAGMTDFHHGHAEGADQEAETLAEALPLVNVHRHPAADFKTPLARDRYLVLQADVLVAAPLQDLMVLRSGTWATVRYARAAGVPVVQVTRDGRVLGELPGRRA